MIYKALILNKRKTVYSLPKKLWFLDIAGTLSVKPKLCCNSWL